MKTEELVIDINNLYVQGLIKVINDFMCRPVSYRNGGDSGQDAADNGVFEPRFAGCPA